MCATRPKPRAGLSCVVAATAAVAATSLHLYIYSLGPTTSICTHCYCCCSYYFAAAPAVHCNCVSRKVLQSTAAAAAVACWWLVSAANNTGAATSTGAGGRAAARRVISTRTASQPSIPCAFRQRTSSRTIRALSASW
eukprot:6815-Heterococcus_DN1.PRE.1